MALRSEYDAILVGAEHNGLILAGYMVRAGLKVVVLARYLEQDLGMVPWWNPISLEDHLSELKWPGKDVALCRRLM